MKSMDFATNSVSISALTSSVNGLTVAQRPARHGLDDLRSLASSTSCGALIECVSSIVST